MKRLLYIVLFGAFLFSYSIVRAAPLNAEGLLFSAPLGYEHVVSGSLYPISLSRTPTVEGAFVIRGADGFLYGVLEGAASSSSLFLWNAGQYATSSDHGRTLDSGAEYYIAYADPSFKTLAKSPLFYLEPAATTTQPVAFFHFDGDARESVSGTHLVAEGGVSYHQGLVGDGAALNGSTGFLAGKIRAAELLREPFSVSFWVKPETDAARDTTYLVGLWSEGEDKPNFAVSLADRGLTLELNRSDASWRWSSGASLVPGVWHHVAVTLDRDATGTLSPALFLDGVKSSSLPSPKQADISKSPAPYKGIVSVSGDPFHVSKRFGGMIDELRWYNAPLSASEISALFVAEGPTRRSLPVASSSSRFFLASLASTVFRPFANLFSW